MEHLVVLEGVVQRDDPRVRVGHRQDVALRTDVAHLIIHVG